MTYLTKILLNAEDYWREKIKDDYSLHRFVYSLFPLENKPDNPRILYADKGYERGMRKIYILSHIVPTVERVGNISTIQVSERFLEYNQYRFEVILNPVKRDSRTGKNIPIKGVLPLLKWFVEKAPSWGFQACEENLEVFVLQTMTFRKGDMNCLFNRAKFKGILSVSDRSLFQQSFINGLGRGKSFGFGLLQLSPISKPQTNHSPHL